MTTKSKKEKVPTLAIGDQILLDVARFDLKMNIPASLSEFGVKHEVRISALKTYGYLYRSHSGWRLTEQGIAYLKRQFPKDDFSRKEIKHNVQQ